MSFQAWVILFQTLAISFCGLTVHHVDAAYEHNPFFQGGNLNKNLTKDLNQINVAVILPPGQELPLTKPGENPPSPAALGYVWVQVPLTGTFNNGGNPSSTNQPLPPSTTQGPITQQPPDGFPTVTSPPKSTKEPVFTIEPPEILYGHDLNKKCLQPNGQFPSYACNKYVNCWQGVATEQTCPLGLVFNPVKLYCDYSGNVDCQGKSIILDQTPVPAILPEHVTISAPTQSFASSENSINQVRKFCLRSTGLFPGSSCGKFVNCWGDRAVEQDCPEGLYFSNQGYCDYPENVECGQKDQKVIASKLEVKNGECPLEFGTFREKSNCNQYYSCAYYKVAARYKCPEGLSFSDILGLCDYSYRVDCTKEPQIYQQKDSNNIQGNNIPFNAYTHPEILQPVEIGDTRCTVSYGLVRDNINCSSYYVCELGKVVASYTCPPGYKFSIELGVCDQEEKVNCNQHPTAYDLNSANIQIPNNINNELLAQVQRCTPGTVFRLNPECTSACRCRNGSAEIIQCSAGLAYDSKMDKCILAHLARC